MTWSDVSSATSSRTRKVLKDIAIAAVSRLVQPLTVLSAVYEGVEEYSFKQFAERREHHHSLVLRGDGPLVLDI